MKLEVLIQEVDELKSKINSIIAAIAGSGLMSKTLGIRGGRFDEIEDDIMTTALKDERYSTRVLVEEYNTLKSKINKLLDTEVAESESYYQYKHLKTGNMYDVINTNIIHCTNGREDEILVLYTRTDGSCNGHIFAREINEFNSKFEQLTGKVVKED